MKIIIASLIALSSISPAFAGESQAGYSEERTCYKSQYREEYVPGTKANPGYIKTYNETVEVPCDPEDVAEGTKVYRKTVVEYDNNDCSEGTFAGGLLGGGLAASISRGKDRWWAIPTGIVTGAMIGCDIDGG